MNALLPELGDLPAEAVFDGEVVAFADGLPPCYTVLPPLGQSLGPEGSVQHGEAA